MGRRLRPHLPGATFHLTSRLHAGLPRFTPGMRTRAVGILREEVDRSDIDMLAYVIMPNHFHLVLRQGEAPLHRFMQPWLTRIALLVQRTWGCVGHVFERRYRDSVCDLDHLRHAIDYTHRNPVRAGLCRLPDRYAWSSYGAWTDGPPAADGGPHPVCHRTATLLLGAGTGVLHGPALEPPPAAMRPDLESIAAVVLAAAPDGLLRDVVRSRFGGPEYFRVRHEIIRRAARAGYRNTQTAAYLRISPSTVAGVLGEERRGRLR